MHLDLGFPHRNRPVPVGTNFRHMMLFLILDMGMDMGMGIGFPLATHRQPIWVPSLVRVFPALSSPVFCGQPLLVQPLVSEAGTPRSEEHTSELQSLRHLVCRL